MTALTMRMLAAAVLAAVMCMGAAAQDAAAPDSAVSHIHRLRQQLDSEDDGARRALLGSLLAGAYADYAATHSYAMHGRTEIAATAAAPADIREWTPQMFYSRIDTLLQLSLADPPLLLRTSAKACKPSVMPRRGGKYYRHCLLQPLAERAVTLYESLASAGADIPVQQRVAAIDSMLIATYAAAGGMEEAVILSSTATLERQYAAAATTAEQDAVAARLDSLITACRSNTVCAEAYILKSAWLDARQMHAEALAVCDEGIRRYRRYRRTGILKDLRAQILRQEASAAVSGFVYPGRMAEFRVSFRNTSDITLRLGDNTHVLHTGAARRYTTHDTIAAVGIPYECGTYAVSLSFRGHDGRKTGRMTLPVTRLKILSLSLPDGSTEMRAVDAATGQPLDGVELTFTRRDGKEVVARLTTGSDGTAVLPPQDRRQTLTYKAVRGTDTALAPQTLYTGGNAAVAVEDGERTVLTLLTDRAVYRAGQTIYIKGVAYTCKGDTAAVAEGRSYTIRLLDGDGREVVSRQATTGSFGSFGMEFALPETARSGSFRICDAQGTASAVVRVEEYRRPSFEITFDPIRRPYRTGDTVHVTGSVTAYSGVSVQDLPLAYTVTAQERWVWRNSRGSKGIAADTVRLDSAGRFDMAVVLKPQDGDGSALYTVEARITDAGGETQQAAVDIEAGRQAYAISPEGIGTYVAKDDSSSTFRVRVLNRSGEEVAADIRYRLYRQLWQGSAEGETLVGQGTLSANTPHALSLWQGLPSAAYRVVFSVAGEESLAQDCRTESSTEFVLYGTGDVVPGSFMDVFCDAEDKTLTFDERHPAVFRFGTSHAKAHVFMDVFSLRRRVGSRVFETGNAIMPLTIDYLPEYGDGVTVLLTFVRDGQTHSRRVRIEKAVQDRTLDMEWQTFRDRMQPGQDEEWRLVVRNPDGTPAAAEMLAMMYDASLDAVCKHSQSLAFRPLRRLPYVSIGESRHHYGAVHLPVSDTYGTLHMPVSRTMPLMTMTKAETVNADGYVEDAAPVSLRTDFAETAFFLPSLQTDSTGTAVLTFRAPESLTRWNVAVYGHTRDMKTGVVEATAVTQKDLMLRPHLPRFVRAGDRLRLTAVVSNLSGRDIDGEACLELFDTATGKVTARQSADFSTVAGGNAAVGFDISIPEGGDGTLGVRMTARGGGFSDGEQHILPVLTGKQCITETVAMSVRGGMTRTYSLDSLFNRHNPSATRRSMTVDLTGNPAWYAMQALPDISDPQHDDALAWAAAYYANTLAAAISGGEPHGGTALAKLKSMQDDDGGWSWFSGMSTDETVTASIAVLLVRLKMLTENIGVAADSDAVTMADGAIVCLHRRMQEHWQDIRRRNKDADSYMLSASLLRYLYLIAISGAEVPQQYRTMYRFFLDKVDNVLGSHDVTAEAQGAVIMKRAGKERKAQRFIASLKGMMVREAETGAHFAFPDVPCTWGMMPILQHVAAMEALRECGGDESLIEEMKLWLLGQKRGRSWSSPVSTADAVYALLCNGSSLLDGGGDARLTLAGETVSTADTDKDADDGTGLRRISRTYGEGTKAIDARSVTVQKDGMGVAWGSVSAQYLSPVTDVGRYGDAMAIDRRLFVERVSADGRKSLEPVGADTELHVGDVVVSRLTLTLGSTLDFVQVTDRAGALLEPVAQLSGYRHGSGTGYYLEVRDAETSLFFRTLGKGVHVFEVRYTAAHTGTCHLGITTLQSTYAPEFSAHTAGGTVRVGQ